MLAAPCSVQTHGLFRARIRLHEELYGRPDRSLHSRRRLQIVIHGGDYDGIANMPPGMAQLDPGEECELSVELLHTTVLEPGMRLILCEGGIHTLGSGSVTSVGST